MQEINLYDLLKYYAKNWLNLLIAVLIGAIAGLVYTFYIQQPLYKSDATLLFVNPSSTRSTQDVTLINNYVELFQSRRVIEPVMQEQGITKSYDAFVGSVTASNEKGTEVIRLSVSTENPQRSQKFLKAAIVSFKNETKELYGTDTLSVVDNASTNTTPYNVNEPLQLGLATAAALVLTLMTLFFIYDIKGNEVKHHVVKTPVQPVTPKPRRFKDKVFGLLKRKKEEDSSTEDIILASEESLTSSDTATKPKVVAKKSRKKKKSTTK